MRWTHGRLIFMIEIRGPLEIYFFYIETGPSLYIVEIKELAA